MSNFTGVLGAEPLCHGGVSLEDTEVYDAGTEYVVQVAEVTHRDETAVQLEVVLVEDDVTLLVDEVELVLLVVLLVVLCVVV